MGHDRAHLIAAAAAAAALTPLLQAAVLADIDWVRVEGDEVSKAPR